jgi:hypothetical protein
MVYIFSQIYTSLTISSNLLSKVIGNLCNNTRPVLIKEGYIEANTNRDTKE